VLAPVDEPFLSWGHFVPTRMNPAAPEKTSCETPTAPRGAPAEAKGRRYTFVDQATLGYVAVVGLIVLCLHGRAVPFWPLLVAAHLACLGLILALIRLHQAYPASRVLDFLRQFYPMLLYGPFYWETTQVNHMAVAGFLDPSIIRLEVRWFGGVPSIAFMDRLPYLAVSEVFYAAYFSYYLMIAGVALALFLRNRRQFLHYVSVTSLIFYVCYLLYIFVPVVGPLVMFGEVPGYQLPADVQPVVAPTFPAAIQSGLFYRLMKVVYTPFEAPGASIPSSHVAVAIVTVYFSFLYLRWIRWPHFAVMILLCAATVYCRYHYVLDVVAGALAAAVLIPVANRLYLRFGRTAGAG
jgi:membrane-associated phospholipid phosphatase